MAIPAIEPDAIGSSEDTTGFDVSMTFGRMGAVLLAEVTVIAVVSVISVVSGLVVLWPGSISCYVLILAVKTLRT